MGAVTFRNSREGEAPPETPVHEDGTLYPFSMHYEGAKYVAFADTPEELLEFLSPGYLDLPGEQERLEARIRLAIRAQVAVQAYVNAEVPPEKWQALSETERKVLDGPRFEQPHGWGAEDPMGDVWDSEVPLVLVDTGYAPYTAFDRPISGIADVQDPPNIIWLRPLDEWEFLESLGRAGFINIYQAADF